jgi:hypothetical protein
MAMLGADSVGYHRENVVARGDDHPGQALAYYASRGETPLVWGGSGAERFGLAGAVTDAQYAAIFGSGGACDPTTGERLHTYPALTDREIDEKLEIAHRAAKSCARRRLKNGSALCVAQASCSSSERPNTAG